MERPYSENVKMVSRLPFVKSGEILFGESTEVTLACETNASKIYYTLDGSEPSETSAVFNAPFTIRESTLLKMKSFAKSLMPSITISVDFKKAVLNEPVKNPNVHKGIAFDYFERFFVTTDDLDITKPLFSGITDHISIKNAPRETYYGYRFNGYINIPGDGIYDFFLVSNDGSKLYIDGKELIENDANHGAVEEPGKVALRSGLHTILVKYFQCGGGKALKVSWAGPGIGKEEIPDSILFH